MFGLGAGELSFEPTIINGFKQIVDSILEAPAKNSEVVAQEKPAATQEKSVV